MIKYLPLLLLVGCSPHGPELESECDETEINLTVKIMDSDAIRREARALGIQLENRDKLLGFATQVKDTNRHSIYVELPRGQNDHQTIETWGHELMHSVCGPWHS